MSRTTVLIIIAVTLGIAAIIYALSKRSEYGSAFNRAPYVEEKS